MSDFQREPIFWASTRPHGNKKDRERRRIVDGKIVIEKIPQTGHVGEYDNYRPMPGRRYMTVVRHDGHVINQVLTCAAAHADTTTSFGLYMRAKGRYHGWFPLGACPLSLVGTGELRRDHLRSSIAEGRDQPCDPRKHNADTPCQHAITELEARRLQRRAEDAAYAATHQDAEQQKLDAMRDQTKAIVEAITGAKVKTKP